MLRHSVHNPRVTQPRTQRCSQAISQKHPWKLDQVVVASACGLTLVLAKARSIHVVLAVITLDRLATPAGREVISVRSAADGRGGGGVVEAQSPSPAGESKPELDLLAVLAHPPLVADAGSSHAAPAAIAVRCGFAAGARRRGRRRRPSRDAGRTDDAASARDGRRGRCLEPAHVGRFPEEDSAAVLFAAQSAANR